MHWFNFLNFPGLLLMACMIIGCSEKAGPSLGTVTGTVTLDGRPLQHASVVFQPVTGRPSAGLTDANGKYSLIYTPDVKGASIGKHQVVIRTTGLEEDDDAAEKKKETLPKKYNDSTELQAEVAPGRNIHDFSLLSK